MKKSGFATAIMMEMCMCMWTCRMRMAFCMFISDMFSISKAKHSAA